MHIDTRASCAAFIAAKCAIELCSMRAQLCAKVWQAVMCLLLLLLLLLLLQLPLLSSITTYRTVTMWGYMQPSYATQQNTTSDDENTTTFAHLQNVGRSLAENLRARRWGAAAAVSCLQRPMNHACLLWSCLEREAAG